MLIADSSEEFASRIISLYEDETLWTAIRNGGFKHVESVCNPRKLKQDISETIIEFAEKKRERKYPKI